jgi:hypothetical protein
VSPNRTPAALPPSGRIAARLAACLVCLLPQPAYPERFAGLKIYFDCDDQDR